MVKCKISHNIQIRFESNVQKLRVPMSLPLILGSVFAVRSNQVVLHAKRAFHCYAHVFPRITCEKRRCNFKNNMYIIYNRDRNIITELTS